jgi:hypothetical protein
LFEGSFGLLAARNQLGDSQGRFGNISDKIVVDIGDQPELGQFQESSFQTRKKMPSVALLDLGSSRSQQIDEGTITLRSYSQAQPEFGVDSGIALTTTPPNDGTRRDLDLDLPQSISTGWARMSELSYGATFRTKNLVLWNAPDPSDVYDQLIAPEELIRDRPDVQLTSEIHVLEYKRLVKIRRALSRLIKSFRRLGSEPHHDNGDTRVSRVFLFAGPFYMLRPMAALYTCQ